MGAGVPSACWAETLVEAALANKAMAIPADSVLWLRANGMQFISIVLSQRLIGLGGFVSIQRPDKNTARSHAKISGTIAASGFPAVLSPLRGCD
ncbi:hypothetical protein Xcc1_23260 [Xanthomonas campestris pv. campestris]|nr:hypothetical protein Xcc1_23260 [Xanthomonas campestris pv. campestris]